MTAEWTLSEAAAELSAHGRTITTYQLRRIIQALGWKSTGKRHSGKDGPPWNTYPAAELQRLHAALTPWLPAAKLCTITATRRIPGYDRDRPERRP